MRDGRLSGEVSVDWPGPIPKGAQRPPASLYRIEAKAIGDRVTGTYQGTFAGQAVSGPVRGRFEAAARQAPRQHLDLFFAHGLPDMGTMYAGGNRELVAACTVAGAASYRFTAEGGFSVENAEPWVATAPLWKTLPIDAQPAAPRGIAMEAAPAETRPTAGRPSACPAARPSPARS
jgi:hypothetical protein